MRYLRISIAVSRRRRQQQEFQVGTSTVTSSPRGITKSVKMTKCQLRGPSSSPSPSLVNHSWELNSGTLKVRCLIERCLRHSRCLLTDSTKLRLREVLLKQPQDEAKSRKNPRNLSNLSNLRVRRRNRVARNHRKLRKERMPRRKR